MSIHFQPGYDSLWIAQPVLQISLAAVMLARKMHRNFPIFFAYVVSQVVIFAVLFPTFHWGGYARYFYAYWIGQAISVALGFEVIHEIFLDVFRPYHALRDLGTVLFKWAALVMLLVAGVVAAASPPGMQGPLVQSVLTVQRCIRVIQCGLILFLLVFSKYVGVSWRQYSFGIALGFGSFAAVELTVVAFNASGHTTQVAISLLNIVAYNLAIVIWLSYAVRKSPARVVAANVLRTERWDRSLGDLQNPLPSDSLIPLFENMVDRAFSRSQENTPEETPVSKRTASASASSG